MRKSRAETARTRRRIIKAAGAELRANGITDAALAQVMSAAGLTHGGFYRHFESKNHLVAEACQEAFRSLIEDLRLTLSEKQEDSRLSALVREYISTKHRKHPSRGCPLAALGSELSRGDARTREVATQGFLRLSQLIADQLGHLPEKKAEARSLAIAATMVGAVTLSRIVIGRRLSDAILASAHTFVLDCAQEQH